MGFFTAEFYRTLSILMLTVRESFKRKTLFEHGTCSLSHTLMTHWYTVWESQHSENTGAEVMI